MTKSILAKQEDGTVQFTITIPKEEIKKTYEEVMVSLLEQAEIPGFRKGKAPRSTVEEKTDKSKIYELVIEKIVPKAYLEAVQEHKITPIINPKVELLKAKEDEDWEIRITTCESPQVELGDYKEKIKGVLAASKIITNAPPITEEERTQKAIDALIETVKVNIPEIILEDEINHSLAGLINQTNSLGMTVEQYLGSIGKTGDQIRTEYREKIIKDLTIQLALNEVSKTEKLEISEKEVEDFINALGDQKTKDDFSKPEQKLYLRNILLRRKALEFISHL